MERPMTWRTSSHSGQNGQCVEVRGDLSAVRDSKNPDGPVLRTAALRHLIRTAPRLGAER